jgi:hypothetical protein
LRLIAGDMSYVGRPLRVRELGFAAEDRLSE